ncbi:E3 ubiquitin-protein ligase MBR1-like protein [Drosera capensis]
MEGPSETDSSRGNFHLGSTVGHGFGTEQVVPLSALDHTGHSFSALLVLPSSNPNEQYESSSMSTLVTHDQGSGEVVINARDNSLPENGNSVDGNIPGTNGMSSLPNCETVVDNGQSSSRKRSVQDDRDGSQLHINPEVPISLADSTRLSGNSSRNVSRRTIVSDQERGRSSPVVPPTNVQLSHSGHRGNARPLHAVELGATAVQVPGNVFGRDVGDLQMGTVGRSQAPANLASLINHASYFAEVNGNGVASAEWWRAAAQREVEHETMRLDVEHMSYEEIVALEELIGDASTGLSEEAIHTHINQHRHPVSHLDPRITPESCTICLDVYEKGQNVGKLDCTHKFHFECIKAWLLRKNSCPLCKAPAVPTP